MYTASQNCLPTTFTIINDSITSSPTYSHLSYKRSPLASFDEEHHYALLTNANCHSPINRGVRDNSSGVTHGAFQSVPHNTQLEQHSDTNKINRMGRSHKTRSKRFGLKKERAGCCSGFNRCCCGACDVDGKCSWCNICGCCEREKNVLRRSSSLTAIMRRIEGEIPKAKKNKPC